MTRNTRLADTMQLGFDSFLAEADTINKAAAFERTHGHLPGTMEEAVTFYRELINRHHAAMLEADIDTVMALREEAGKLARKLNKGDPGILAGPDAPGYVLARETAAQNEAVPLWGQAGLFVVEVGTMRVRIETDGIFGVGASYMAWPGFGAHAVEWDQPFLSETGYRSFFGLTGGLVPNLTQDAFVRQVIAQHVKGDLRGRLRAIAPEHRPEGGIQGKTTVELPE